MNSIRPLISYSELLAAKQHIKLIKKDLLKIKKEILKDIETLTYKLYINNIETNEALQMAKFDLKLNTDQLEDANNTEILIDEKFLSQAAQIQFQIDINYPEV